MAKSCWYYCRRKAPWCVGVVCCQKSVDVEVPERAISPKLEKINSAIIVCQDAAYRRTSARCAAYLRQPPPTHHHHLATPHTAPPHTHAPQPHHRMQPHHHHDDMPTTMTDDEDIILTDLCIISIARSCRVRENERERLVRRMTTHPE